MPGGQPGCTNDLANSSTDGQGASSPALLGLNTLVRLTDREREVALLAITGIGNKEIAERLFVSVRTVDNHLQHVYEKLGVKSRAELGNELGSARSRRP